MKSTIFRNFNEVTEQKDILKILSDIKTGVYQNAITYLRKSLADNKKEAAERAKKSLPAFTPSATFNGGRKMEFLTNYNVIPILIDFPVNGKISLSNSSACFRCSGFLLSTKVMAFPSKRLSPDLMPSISSELESDFINSKIQILNQRNSQSRIFRQNQFPFFHKTPSCKVVGN